MTPYLQQNWNELTAGLPEQKQEFLLQLEQLYSSPQRHYHTLVHITALHRLTDLYGGSVEDVDAIRWAIWYHDAIYDVTKDNNEEKSAKLAREHMTMLGVGHSLTDSCCNLILLTKTHTPDEQTDSYDARFMLDIDLLILGAVPEKYEEYTRQIRQEYSIYPDMLYNPGRKKVLQHFLNLDRIYRTDQLHHLYEGQARINIAGELERLG